MLVHFERTNGENIRVESQLVRSTGVLRSWLMDGDKILRINNFNVKKEKINFNMNFIEAITSAFNNYFNFKGRSSRSAFWFFVLFEVVYFFLAGFLLGVINVNDEIFDLAILVLVLPIFLPGISLTARRLHDFNQSGWMQCIFIPGFFADTLLGTGYVIYLLTLVIFVIYLSQQPTNGKNKFGPKPKK